MTEQISTFWPIAIEQILDYAEKEQGKSQGGYFSRHGGAGSALEELRVWLSTRVDEQRSAQRRVSLQAELLLKIVSEFGDIARDLSHICGDSPQFKEWSELWSTAITCAFDVAVRENQ